MNAKISYFNFTIFNKNLTQFCPVWIMYLLMLFLLMPFSVWTTIQHTQRYQEAYSFSAADLTNTVNLVLMDNSANLYSILLQAFYAVVCAGIVFRYLYAGRSAGMIHALPLKRICLYISNVLSGLTMLLVPQIVITLLTVPILAVKGYGNYSCLFSAFAMTAGYSFFFYSLAIFCALLVGHILALPALFAFFNFFVLIAEYIIRGIISMLLFGFTFDPQQLTLSFLSPIYYFYHNIQTMTDKKIPYFASSTFAFIGIYTVVGIIFILLSYLLYKRRNIETSGDPITVKKLQPILKIAFTFITSCVITLIIYSASIQEHYVSFADFIFIFILSIISGFLCSYAYEMILQKSFKVLKKGLPGALLYCIIISATLLIIKTDLFGFVKKVPDPVDIKQIHVTSNSSSIITSDSGAIKSLTDIQQMIIDDKDSIINDVNQAYQTGSSDITINDLNIQYKLRNGNTIVRNYTIPVTGETLADSSSFAGKFKEFLNTTEYIMDSLNYLDSIKMKVGSIDVNTYHTDNYTDKASQTADSNYFSIPDADIPMVYKALKQDIELGGLKLGMDLDDSNSDKILYTLNLWYYNANDTNRSFHNLNYYYTFQITADCVNVINALNSLTLTTD